MVYLYPHPIPVLPDSDADKNDETRVTEESNGVPLQQQPEEETFAESSTQARKRQQQQQVATPHVESSGNAKRRKTIPRKITTQGTIALLLPSSTLRNSWELIASQWGEGEVPDVTGLGREFWQDVRVDDETRDGMEDEEVKRTGVMDDEDGHDNSVKVNGTDNTPSAALAATNGTATSEGASLQEQGKEQQSDVANAEKDEKDGLLNVTSDSAENAQPDEVTKAKAGETTDVEEGEIAETPPAIPGLRSPSMKHIVVAPSPMSSVPVSPTQPTQTASIPPPPLSTAQRHDSDIAVNDLSLSPVLTPAHYAPKVIALAKKIAASRGVKLVLDAGMVEKEREKLAMMQRQRRRGNVENGVVKETLKEAQEPKRTLVKIEEPIDLLDSAPSTPAPGANGRLASESGFTGIGYGDDDGGESQSGTPFTSRFPSAAVPRSVDGSETPDRGYEATPTPGLSDSSRLPPPPGSPTSSLAGAKRGTKSKGRGTGRWAGHWAAKAAAAAARAERLAAVAEEKARAAEQERLGLGVSEGGRVGGDESRRPDAEAGKRGVALALGSSSWWNHLLIEARKARGPQWDENTEMYQVDRGSALYYQSTRSPPKTPPPASPEPLPKLEHAPTETPASPKPTTNTGRDSTAAVGDNPPVLSHSPVLQMSGMSGGVGRPGSSGTGTMGPPPPPPMMMGMGQTMHHPTPPITHAAAAVLGIQQHATAPSPSDILTGRRSMSGRASATPVMLNALGLPEPSPGGASVHSLSHGGSTMGPPPAMGQAQGMSVSPMLMTNRQVPTPRSGHAGMGIGGPTMGYPVQGGAGGMYGQQQQQQAMDGGGLPMGMAALPHRGSFGATSGQAVQDPRASQPPPASMSPVHMLGGGGSQISHLGPGGGSNLGGLGIGDGMNNIPGPQQPQQQGTPTPEQQAILQARLQQQHILQRQALAAAQQGQVAQNAGLRSGAGGAGGGFGAAMVGQQQTGLNGINPLNQSQGTPAGGFSMQQVGGGGGGGGGMNAHQQQQVAAFLRQQGMNMNPQQMAALGMFAQQQQQQRSQNQSQTQGMGQNHTMNQGQAQGGNTMFPSNQQQQQLQQSQNMANRLPPQFLAQFAQAQAQQQAAFGNGSPNNNNNVGLGGGGAGIAGGGNGAGMTGGGGPGGMTQDQARQLMGMQAALHQQRMMQRQQQQQQQGGGMQGGGGLQGGGMQQQGGGGMQSGMQGGGGQGQQQSINPALMAQFLQNQQQQQR